MNSRVFNKFIKKVDPKFIQQYDDVSYSGNNGLRGVRTKKFVRFDSVLFYDLICELQNNPNCSYDTYVNELIKENYIPNHISVLEKKDNGLMSSKDEFGLGHFKDVIASRILNMFGCPTAYETIFNIDGEVVNCSVDFGRIDEDFYILGSMIPMHKSNVNILKNRVPEIIDKLKFFCNKNGIEDCDDLISQFIDDYCYSILIRKYLILDSDCGYNNIGFIHNFKNNSFRLSPSFDLEYAFSFITDRHIKFTFNKEYQDDLRYLKLNNPHILKRFLEKLQKLNVLNNGKSEFISIVEKVVGENKHSEKFINKLYCHVNDLISLSDDILTKGATHES